MAVNHLEPPLRAIRPRWPDPALVDPERVVFSYWREVDTLMIDFFGQARPAVSVPLNLGGDRDYVFLRVDPTSDEVVGLQVEDFLAYAVGERPVLWGALDLADLHGITPAEIAGLRRESVSESGKRAVVNALFTGLAPLSA